MLRDTGARLTRTLGAEHPDTLRACSSWRTRGGLALVDEGAALFEATHAKQTEVFPDSVETRRTAARLGGGDSAHCDLVPGLRHSLKVLSSILPPKGSAANRDTRGGLVPEAV